MHRIRSHRQGTSAYHEPTYGGRDFRQAVPKFVLPEGGMDAAVAYQIVHDELTLDANPSLNLASFLTTWMEPEARQLIDETLSKNLIDEEEYPQTHALAERVLSMQAHLFHAPDGKAVGCTTGGSSEAIMLGLLAHKRAWQRRREAQGKPTAKPNLVMGADVHTCLEKFTRYFEVEPRIAPMRRDAYTLSAADVETRIDENTIAVCGVLGTTFTGQMDDLAGINELLKKTESARGWHIPLHVDAASGGLIVPFARPDLAWDFRLSQVRSINVSNHKFGLVYAGMGSLLFREASDLPDELVFHINYLGGDMPNYSLNFSRPSALVVAQYYTFLRLGMQGYQRLVENVLKNARYLAERLRAMECFEVIGDGHLFPVISAAARQGKDALDLKELSMQLRQHGWVVPVYALPADAQDTTVLRLVVRESLSRDMIDALCDHIADALPRARHRDVPSPPGNRPIC